MVLIFWFISLLLILLFEAPKLLLFSLSSDSIYFCPKLISLFWLLVICSLLLSISTSVAFLCVFIVFAWLLLTSSLFWAVESILSSAKTIFSDNIGSLLFSFSIILLFIL